MYDWELELSRDVDWEEILIAEAESKPIGVIIIGDPALESRYWATWNRTCALWTSGSVKSPTWDADTVRK